MYTRWSLGKAAMSFNQGAEGCQCERISGTSVVLPIIWLVLELPYDQVK